MNNALKDTFFDERALKCPADTSNEQTWLATSDTDDDESDYSEKEAFDGWRHELRDK